ncbi:MAG: hypothetical protein LUQ25_09775 [Methanoregulaceae archaeon]|nr:hypothetical protein [Methanoregulaceae archaeon]
MLHLEIEEVLPRRIETGTTDGDILGFTEDLFSGWLEIYQDSRLYLYYIISRCKNEGNTQKLLRRWIGEGYDVRIVKPSHIMQHILGAFGYVKSFENLSRHYDHEVEVWRRQDVPAIPRPGE